MKRRLIGAGLLAACAIAASASPAFGDDVGTVSAQVTAAAPCIQVTPAQLDFGSLSFSQSSASAVAGTRSVTLTSCGGGSQNVFARGTNATSSTGTTWVLEPNVSDLCSTMDRYMQRVSGDAGSVPLSTQNAPVASLAASQAVARDAFVVMPCVGSNGAGQTMTFSYVFTAILA